MKMENIWAMFCAADQSGSSQFELWNHPFSCTNNALMIFFDVVLLIMLLITVIKKPSSKLGHVPSWFQGLSFLQIVSAVFNSCLGLSFLFFGFFILEQNLKKNHTVVPLNQWLQALFQGFTWLLVALIVSIKVKQLPRVPVRLLSILASLFAGFACVLSLFAALSIKQVTIKIALDVLSFPGAVLLLLCAYKSCKYEESDEDVVTQNGLYTPLNGEPNSIDKGSHDSVTPFAKAGWFSKYTFGWLHSLMKMGKEKTLKEEDMPRLREDDRAESCYQMFLEQLEKQKLKDPSSQPSLLKIILLCHWKEIFISGFFALIKILTLSAGPLLLNAFILVAEGKQSFKYEGYVLAITLFISKSLESISQRQWYFRSRLIGLQVRSLLTASIYNKQLRLSNSARLIYSSGEIMNYVTVDAYRIGEFPFSFHNTWTTSLQICIALVILFQSVGLATVAALVAIILTVICNAPLAKLQHKFQVRLMTAQDERLKALSEALVNMKVLKLYAWETHFKNVVESLRTVELKWLLAVQFRKAYNSILLWASPILVSAATFGACYFLKVPLHANNVFTFLATLRLVQEPIRSIPDIISVVIQAKVAFSRIETFLEAPELQFTRDSQKFNLESGDKAIICNSADFSWEDNLSKPTLRNINLQVSPGEKVAICGEVGSGKSTLLAAILGEVPNVQGSIQVYRNIAYVSQTAWIQTGTIQDNILFGSPMDGLRYRETLEKCSLVKDFELLPYGDLTEIGERGVNLSGGQKQRIQLARALYQNADVYLLDDPFSAVDAHTATSLFNEYVMEALSNKTVMLVTHQVDFLPAFDSVLIMSDGEILESAPYHELLLKSKEFQDLVNAHKETAGSERLAYVNTTEKLVTSSKEIRKSFTEKNFQVSTGDQLIKVEEREIGDAGLRPYIQYLSQNKGYLYFIILSTSHLIFAIGLMLQNSWMAVAVDNPHISTLKLILIYLLIGCCSLIVLLLRSISIVYLSIESSKSLFSQLLNSLFRSPMSFYDSTPLGRILSRVSSDLSIVDMDVAFGLFFAVGSSINAIFNLGVLAVIAWQVLFVSLPTIYLAFLLQKYYFATTKELMRINGTTKSLVANHLAESVAGAITIRAFKREEQFFMKSLELIDINASPFFHSFAASEWLIQRLETLSATILASAAFCMVLLPPETLSSGFIGMALTYGLSMNISVVNSIQRQCILTNYMISVERLNQYMCIPSEAPEVIKENRPPTSWPNVGKARDLWLQFLPSERVLPFGCKDNFWEMGDTGPCGPCTEIHYDRIGNRDAASLVNNDDPTCIEIWNLVFIQFNRESDGSLKPLPAKHVDTGMGFERLTSILQNKMSNYDTDVFLPIFDAIQKTTGARPYSGKVGAEDVDKIDMAYRVVADHIRTLSFAIADGSCPGNEGREYVLRRILRRAVRYGSEVLKAQEGFFHGLVDILVKVMGDVFPELKQHEVRIREIIADEEASFGKTLLKGIEKFKKAAQDVEGKTLSGQDAFVLWDTFGFPLDLTQLMAEERGLQVDVDGFNKAMDEARERSRNAQNKQSGGAIVMDADATAALHHRGIAATDDSFKFTWFKDHKTTVKAIYTGSEFVDSVSADVEVGIVLSSTSFYAEQGGQIFDTGVLEGSFGSFQVVNVQIFGGFILHIGYCSGKNGRLSVGDESICKVDYERRKLIAPNHTCTHMLNFALREVLGNHVDQKGSIVLPEKLRFDFSHGKPVDPNDLRKIENIVNEQIEAKLDVFSKEVNLADAKRINSLRAVFGEVYPDPVRVVAIGKKVDDLLADPENDEWSSISAELCGGTHISNTKEAKAFALLSEEGIAKGIRRITAVTTDMASEARDLANSLEKEVDDASREEGSSLEKVVASLKNRVDSAPIPAAKKADIRTKIALLQSQVRKAQKKIAEQNLQKAIEVTIMFAENALSEGKTYCICNVDVGLDVTAVREAVSKVMKDKGISAMVFSTDETTNKAVVCAGVPEKGDKSKLLEVTDWLTAALEPLKGRCGKGKGGLATGQGTDASHVQEAMSLAASFAGMKLK